MALRLCKGKYKIVELKDNKDFNKTVNEHIGSIKDYFTIIKVNNKFKCYIDLKGNENFNFLSKEKCFENAHEVFIRANLEYIPIIHNDKIIGFIYDDYYLDDALNKIKDLIAFDNGKTLKDMYDNAIIYGYNELTYYLEKLFIKNNFNYKIVDGLFGKDNEIFENSRTMKIYVEGNNGDHIANYSYWKVFHEWIFDAVKPIYEWYNLVNKFNYSNEKVVCDYLDNSKPFMMARVGNTELWIVKQYIEKQLNIIDKYSDFWLKYLFDTSGFFSKDNNILDVDRFAMEHIQAIKNCDFNLCFGKEDLAEALNITLKYIQNGEHFNYNWDNLTNPFNNKWFSHLKNKKVLIISPYSESIKTQLKNMNKLYSKEYPEMSIITYQTMQTQLGNSMGYNSFFDALEKMKEDIKKLDFDIAFICAGAYGFLLADFVKNIGKSSIELCSYLPNWFGVKIKRYCTYLNVNKYWNKNWIFPVERPIDNSEKIEDSCYWE